MRGIRSVAGCSLVALGFFAAGASPALRDTGPPTDTTTTVPLPETTTTLPVTTTPPPTTTAPATTTTAPATTTTAPKPRPKPVPKHAPPPSCSHGSELAVFPPTGKAFSTSGGSHLRGCASGGQGVSYLAANRVEGLAFLSVAARSVSARVAPAGGAWTLRGSVTGLRLAGAPVAYSRTLDVPIGRWGRLQGATVVGRFAAPLAIRVVERRGSLRPGTTILLGYVGDAGAYRPEPAIPAAAKGTWTRVFPLPVEPPLLGAPYVFPVAGTTQWGDSFGGPRTDVSGGWHHGDDIFAKLGTPVVAVADGHVYSIGWERLGGWRLWVKDRQGNRFYYAHLSGYAPAAKNHGEVTRGEVIGYIGHTGDAFTTPAHLHFEVHPASLLRLGYDGAVDPTPYLTSWKQLAHVHIPVPAPLPAGASKHGEGAVSDYRRLLALRGPAPSSKAPQGAPAAPAPGEPQAVAIGAAPARAAASAQRHWAVAGGAAAVAILLTGLLSLYGQRAWALVRRLR